MTHVHGSRFAEAADYLRRGIARSGPDESHLRKAFALLVYAEMRLGRQDAALRSLPAGPGAVPQGRRAAVPRGRAAARAGPARTRRGEPTSTCWTTARTGTSPASTAALTGFKARQNLAVVAGDMGDLAEAERQWRRGRRAKCPATGRAGAGWARR